jgi:Mg2+ and Co2+ transporter CorA
VHSLPLSDEVLKLHQDVEFALDLYLREYNVAISKLKKCDDILTKDTYSASLHLDFIRNDLLKTNLILTIVSTCFTTGGFIAGIFGMNLDNTIYLQNAPGGFISVTVVTTVVIIIGIAIGYSYFVRERAIS